MDRQNRGRTSAGHTCVPVLLLLSGVLCGTGLRVPAACAQGAPPAASQPSLATPVEAELQRACADLQTVLREEQIDFARDSVSQMLAKQARIEEALRVHSQNILDRLARPGLLVQNCVLIRNAVTPRLTGRVLRVGPERELGDLVEALGEIETGDVLALDPGDYVFEERDVRGARPRWTDIAIVGLGPEKPRLTATFHSAKRLRLENLRLACDNNPAVDAGAGACVYLRDCTLSGYNSGAGGSNAIGLNDGAVFAENCTFEGRSGRGGPNRFGTAFDLRGHFVLYARGCVFVNNTGIVQAFSPCAFEHCRARETREGAGVQPSGAGRVLLCDSDVVEPSNERSVIEFKRAADDPAFVEGVLGRGTDVDEMSRRLIEAQQLGRNVPYWIGLLRDPRPDVRTKAAARLKALLAGVGAASPAEKIDPAALQDGGSAPLPDNPALLAAEREYARLIDWYEVECEGLRWDAAAGTYRRGR